MNRKTASKKSKTEGTVRKVESGFLLPPRPDVCQECAVKHDPGMPHNRDSLYYQIKFNAEHGRYPQWSDAVAHCSPEMRAAWQGELEKQGVWSEPVEGMPKEERVARVIADLPTHSKKASNQAGILTVLKGPIVPPAGQPLKGDA